MGKQDPAKCKAPPWRPTKYTSDMCQKVVEIGKTGASLTRMARDLGIDRETLKNYRDRHPAFSAAVKRAQEEAICWWEQQLEDVAFGKHAETDENGRYTAPPVNATLIIFRMKSQFRDEYGEQPKNLQDESESHTFNINLNGAPLTPGHDAEG